MHARSLAFGCRTRPWVSAGIGILISFFFGLLPMAAMAETSQFPELADIPLEHVDKSPRWRYLEVLSALDRDGYNIVSVEETFLGRIRIRAANKFHLREIVVSRASGQILRDAIVTQYQPLPPEPPATVIPPSGLELGEGIYIDP
jgi:hypothetical protein